MNNSLYGGHDGRPFVITNSYTTVAAMTEDFAKGLGCTAVQYGEYVLISCDNKNNPEHGQIYRREANYWSETKDIESWTLTNGEYKSTKIANYGARFIGTIVGPSGGAPKFHMRDFTTLTPGKGETENSKTFIEKLVKTIDSNYSGDVENDYPESQRHFGGASYSISNKSLVPGKDGKNYNDAIQYKYICIRNANGDLTYAFVGFQFPYLVTEFIADKENAYYNGNFVEAVDDGTHPFYKQWKIHIPQGYHGRSIENFRIDTYNNVIASVAKNSGNKQINLGFEADKDTHELIYDAKKKLVPSGAYQLTTTNNNAQIIVCDLVDYNNKAEGERYTLCVGEYDVLSDIQITEDGYVKGQYTYSEEKTLNENNPMVWITHASLDERTVADPDINGKYITEYLLNINYNNTELDENNKYKYAEPINNLNLRTVTRIYSAKNAEDQNALYADYNDGTTFQVISDLTSLNIVDTTSITTNQSDTEIDNRLINGGICFVIGDNAV
jgi:hypothetical protein